MAAPVREGSVGGGGDLMVKVGDLPGGPPGEITGLFCNEQFYIKHWKED